MVNEKYCFPLNRHTSLFMRIFILLSIIHMIMKFYTLHIWNSRIRYADNNNGQNGISVGLKRNNCRRFAGTFKNSRSHGDSSYAGTVTIIRGAARLRIFFLFLPAITKGTIHSTEQELRPMRAGNSFLRSSTRRRRETRVHMVYQGFWIRGQPRFVSSIIYCQSTMYG